jgi:hypothetical protein
VQIIQRFWRENIRTFKHRNRAEAQNLKIWVCDEADALHGTDLGKPPSPFADIDFAREAKG